MRQQGAAAGGLDQRAVELVHVHGHGVGEAGQTAGGFEQVAVVGGVLFQSALFMPNGTARSHYEVRGRAGIQAAK